MNDFETLAPCWWPGRWRLIERVRDEGIMLTGVWVSVMIGASVLVL